MWNSRYTLIGLLGCVLLVRGGMLIAVPWSLRADPDGYRRLAENLVECGTLGAGDRPTAFRPPLYPLALSPCVAAGAWSRTAVGALHLALGAATVGLVFRMVDRRGSRRSAILAGALTACDPILLWQSTLVMTETLAAFLAVLAITLLIEAAERPDWPWALGAGVCLGLAILCRPTFLPFAAIAGLVVLARRGSLDLARRGSPDPAETADRQLSIEPGRPSVGAVARSGDRPQRGSGDRPQRGSGDRPQRGSGDRPQRRSARLKLLGCAAAGMAVVLFPWVARNQIQFGRPILATTHGGYTLLLGNNPFFYEYLRSGPWGIAWDVDELQRAREARAAARGPVGELEADRLAYEEAWVNIRRAPGMFAYACLVRVGRLWSPLPHQTNAEESAPRRGLRYVVGLWYLLELPLAAFGVVLWFRGKGQAGWLWWLLLALGFTAVHALYWTDMRMRAPLMPGVALAAAAGITALVDRCRTALVRSRGLR